jgi:hypothetical protein
VTPKVAEAVGEFAAARWSTAPTRAGTSTRDREDELPRGRPAGELQHFFETIEKIRPSTVKGTYIKKITLSGTQTPAACFVKPPARPRSRERRHDMSKPVKELIMRDYRDRLGDIEDALVISSAGSTRTTNNAIRLGLRRRTSASR